MMMICKNASNGEQYGKDAFVQWSLRDESGFSNDPVEYTDKMWPTLDAFREGGLTCGSLDHEVKQARIKTDAVAFGDEGDDVLPQAKAAKTKAPKAKPKYDAKVVSDEALGEDVWHTAYMPKIDSHVITKTEQNLIQLLLQRKLPAQFGNLLNPLAELFKYNELKQTVVYSKTPPWARIDAGKRAYVNLEVQEQDVTELRIFVHTRYDLAFGKAAAESAINAAAYRIPYHPAREYCESLDWDWEERLETFLIECAGAPDNPYVRAISKKFMLGVIARIYKPGCKMDNIVILEGKQGIGKSTLLDILGGEWYSAPEIKIGDKDAEQNLQGCVIAEWAEFAHGYRELEAFKAWCTKRVNRFRGSYGKNAKDWPRTCVIVVTMNPDGDGCYLIDRTGNRRMWPVELRERVNFKWLTDNRDQLFAEAVAYYKAGEQWHLTRAEEKLARKETNKRVLIDPWEQQIHDYLTTGSGKKEAFTTPMHIAVEVFNMEARQCDLRLSRKIGGILRKMKWYHSSYRDEGKIIKAFRRPAPELEG